MGQPVYDLDWNRRTWGQVYDWSRHGEEWSGAEGTAHKWETFILPRIGRYFGQRDSVLEIGPGHGRWTKYLLEQFRRLCVGVDLTAGCAEYCYSRFAADYLNFLVVVNDGVTLPFGGFDFIFSFDSLVHAEEDVMAAYASQFASRLTKDGVGFIHHSNYAAGQYEKNPGCRAVTMSAEKFRAMCEANGLAVISQEIIDCAAMRDVDCLTLFRRA